MLAALYDEADIYVNASSIDNQPLSILESFAAGLPVVTTAAGGIPDLVRHDVPGLMVPLDDDRALADQVLRLLEEPGLATRLASHAREEFLARFRWDRIRDLWIGTYYGELRLSPVRVTVVAPSTQLLGGRRCRPNV